MGRLFIVLAALAGYLLNYTDKVAHPYSDKLHGFYALSTIMAIAAILGIFVGYFGGLVAGRIMAILFAVVAAVAIGVAIFNWNGLVDFGTPTVLLTVAVGATFSLGAVIESHS